MACLTSIVWPALNSNVVDVSLSGGSLGYWIACNNFKRHCTLPYCDINFPEMIHVSVTGAESRTLVIRGLWYWILTRLCQIYEFTRKYPPVITWGQFDRHFFQENVIWFPFHSRYETAKMLAHAATVQCEQLKQCSVNMERWEQY